MPNVFIRSVDSFSSLKDFKTLICSDSNKRQLQDFLEDTFAAASQQSPQVVIYCVGNKCSKLSTSDDVSHFKCEQAEADTAMFTIFGALRDPGYDRRLL